MQDVHWDTAEDKKDDEFDYEYSDDDYPIEESLGGDESQKNMIIETAVFLDHVAYKRCRC